MKTKTGLVLGCLLLLAGLVQAVPSGELAPDFSVKDSAGTSHLLSDYKGKYVVLEWTRYTCPFVEKFYDEGHMQALQKEFTDQGVVWFQVASSAPGKSGYLEPASLQRIRERDGTHSTATLVDSSGAVGRLYDARTTPHMYLIGPDGVLLYQGAIDSIRSADTADIAKATNYLKQAYEAAVAGEPIKPAATKPYGCGVKY
ncbi:redoxin domain-containing protein [Coraliomargarita akajimensis]|nr:redoxin domain-containing protein [Coraliomargarita akajimensis]